jgi:CxxC-x17-CxxC domain-containing protein
MNDFKRNDGSAGSPHGRFGGRLGGGGFGGKPGFQRHGGRPQGPMFQATCVTCGKPCEVPFKPDGSRPIYCREHYGNKSSAPAQSGGFHQRPQAPFVPSQPRQAAPDPRIDELKRAIEKLTLKIDEALLHLQVTKATNGAKATPKKKAKVAKKK